MPGPEVDRYSYPFYELFDEDLDRIDLTDGSVDDWLDTLGEPSLITTDFLRDSSAQTSDPADLDVRVWLAWHRNSGTLWVALEGFDDLYYPGYLGDGGEAHESCFTWDACMQFFIDGDHSGGRYWGFGGDYTEAELDPMDYRKAQRWWSTAERSPNGQHIRFSGAGAWVTLRPYAAAGGGTLGRSPATFVIEMMVTPFDHLVHGDEDLSEASELYPGKTMGFELWLHDADSDAPLADSALYLLSRLDLDLWSDASGFVDGLLIGAGADPSLYDDVSAVEPSSWARIKAALQ